MKSRPEINYIDILITPKKGSAKSKRLSVSVNPRQIAKEKEIRVSKKNSNKNEKAKARRLDLFKKDTEIIAKTTHDGRERGLSASQEKQKKNSLNERNV